ncbi:MAG: sulfur carrier protein ThiS [Granulosicoccus sp.]
MKIMLNGEPAVIVCDTLQELLLELGHDERAVATAVNKVFVPVAIRASTELTDGDHIEIIAPMAGG